MRKTRFIFADNGTLDDWTSELNNYHAGTKTFSLVAAQDYIYIGMAVPFNHFYVRLSTPSVAVATMSVDYYSGNGWTAAVEVMDETEGFTQSGAVVFVPDKGQGWAKRDTSGSGGSITELSSVEVYDKYWARIKFNNDLTANTVINWVGNIFSDDNELGTEFPELTRTNVLSAFESGKTDWQEQHVRAASIIINDLIRKQVIKHRGQILERESYTLASVQKTAELIFNSFGDDYRDNRDQARLEYERRINKSIYDVDQDGDARLDEKEIKSRQGFASR